MSTIYHRRPDGFRAVKFSDSQRIYYCWEENGETHAESHNHKFHFVVEQKKSFNRLFCHEHSPEMPPAVKARFEGKPTFAQWWDAKNEAKQ